MVLFVICHGRKLSKSPAANIAAKILPNHVFFLNNKKYDKKTTCRVSLQCACVGDISKRRDAQTLCRTFRTRTISLPCASSSGFSGRRKLRNLCRTPKNLRLFVKIAKD